MSQQQKGGGQEPDYGFALLIAFTLGIIFIAYSFFHVYFIHFTLYFKYYELKILDFFFPNDTYSSLIDNIYYDERLNLSSITFGQVQAISSFIGNSLLWPFAILGVLFSAILYFFHPTSGYKETETMDSLRGKLKPIYPCIQVVSELDLVKQPINKGPWAMALTPIEFTKKYKLLARKEDGVLTVDNLKTRILLTEQLGPLWLGADVLSKPQRAIFAALCLFIDYRRDEGEKLLEQFASSATKDSVISGKLDYKGVDATIKKYISHPKVEQILSTHAYVYTVFSQMMTQARTTGIVASASFLWLKPVDRLLWYTLNNVGRKAVFIETGAVTAHWKAEVKLGCAVPKPLIDSALDALKEAVTTRIIKDIDKSMSDNKSFDDELEVVLQANQKNNPKKQINKQIESKSEPKANNKLETNKLEANKE
jgi:intracellular multiplication protein IcmP